MPNLYVAKNGAWVQATDAWIEHNGAWAHEKIRMVGVDGRWVESFNSEGGRSRDLLDVFSLSYRAGGQLQGALDINGFGLTDVVTPEPRVGTFYTFRGTIGDYFDNFGKLELFGSELPLPTVEDGAMAYAFDAGKQQYAALPLTGVGVYDLLALMGNDANAVYEPRGTKHWEIGGKVKPKAWPAGPNQAFLYWSGTVDQHIAVWFVGDGTMHARFKNGSYEKVLSVPSAVFLDKWVGFVFRHRPSGALRSLELDVLKWDVATERYIVHKDIVYGDMPRTVNGITYSEFAYWKPAAGTPIRIGSGEQVGGAQDASKFFLPESTHAALTISADGLELTGTTTTYRSAVPSGWMPPGTGRYYIEVLNRASYDLHLGVTDQSTPDLAQAPGVIGWCVNTINGRKFAKQTGGGTVWTSAIPAGSTIGLMYDSSQGLIKVYVDGVKRADPFPAGTITVPVRFIIGGRAQSATKNLFNPKCILSPSLWAYSPADSTHAPVPYSREVVPGGTVYTTGVYKDFFVRNAPMTSLERSLAVLDPSLKFEIMFQRISDGTLYQVNSYILKMTGDLVIINVPDLPDGNYLIKCRLSEYGESTPRLFTIRSLQARNTAMHVNFASSDVEHIRRELMVGHKQWGGLNGGIVAENVLLDRPAGLCELTAYGDLYTGKVKGVDRFGRPSGFNTRIGACVVTRDYYGPASYRVVMKPAQREGVCNAFWSFHYEEGYPGSQLFNRHLADDLHISGNEVSGFYTVRNHEIDIEFPTALKTNPDQEDVDFHHARFNTWRGELRNWDVPNSDVPVSDPMYSPVNDPEYWSEYTDDFVNHGVNLADGQFHELRYDWHLGDDPRVEFYIDGVLKHTVRTHIPDIPGRFWAGLWFPSGDLHWAGRGANWVFEKMYIKSIDIIPFVDEFVHVRPIVETYPYDVFRDFKNIKYE